MADSHDLETAGLERIMQAREAKARLEGDKDGYLRGLRFAMSANGDVKHPIELGAKLKEEINRTLNRPLTNGIH